jgi:hypothetical protein
VNCNQELRIELSVVNFHCETEPANLLQYFQKFGAYAPNFQNVPKYFEKSSNVGAYDPNFQYVQKL